LCDTERLPEVTELFCSSDHQGKVYNIENPENPVKDILFNPVLKTDHGDKYQVDQSSHDKSLGSEPVVMSFTVVISNLIGAIIL
jgi:hypothetical protein